MRKLYHAVTVSSAIIMLLSTLYHGGLLAYIETLQASDYSYLLLLAPASLYIVFSSSTSRGLVGGGIDASRLLGLLGALAFSTLLYALSRIIPEYSLQLEALSATTLFSSIILYSYSGFQDWKTPLAIWLLLLALIPAPRQALDALSAALTGPTVWLASLFSGAKTATSPQGYTVLVFQDSQHVLRRLEIAPICSGIASLLTILALIPLAAYIAATSTAPRAEKAKALLLAAITGTTIVILGNALRIALIVHLSRTISYETGMLLAHQAPALVYAAAATLAVLYIVLRLPRKNTQEKHGEPKLVSIPDIAKTILLLALILAYTALALTATGEALKAAQEQGQEISIEKLLHTPAQAVFNTGTGISIVETPSPLLGEALGALTVHRITIKTKTILATGYIEIAETPSRFHQWQVCLTAQGYTIEKWWTENNQNTTITYALVRGKTGRQLLLAYTIYRYPTKTTPVYIRISLFTPTTKENQAKKAALLAEILEKAKPPKQEKPSLDILTWTAYLGLTATLTAPAAKITRIIRPRSYPHKTTQ